VKYLLDTHTLLWWLENNKKLNPKTRKIIEDSDNIVFASVANAWEISIKLKARPDFKIKLPLEEWFNQINLQVLPISLDHILQLDKLPPHHKDPFDRILISQAKSEKLTLITADAKITKYKIKTLKA
jgi:PIN domain nuclease of toxin-antitoxin system